MSARQDPSEIEAGADPPGMVLLEIAAACPLDIHIEVAGVTDFIIDAQAVFPPGAVAAAAKEAVGR